MRLTISLLLAVMVSTANAQTPPKVPVTSSATLWSAPHIPYDAAPHVEADGRVRT